MILFLRKTDFVRKYGKSVAESAIKESVNYLWYISEDRKILVLKMLLDKEANESDDFT